QGVHRPLRFAHCGSFAGVVGPRNGGQANGYRPAVPVPNPLESLKALGDQLRAQIGEELDIEVLRRSEPARPLEELLAELDALPGLESVKEQVRALVAFLRVQARRKEAGLPEVATTQHLVFLGNPGTGKTPVARLLALMHRFLESNPGLRSRFSREITFPDYSTGELVEIFVRFAAESEYHLAEGADAALREILGRAERDESFGNARFARTLFEQSLNAQALRLGHGDVETLTQSELTALTADDLRAGARALGE